MRRRSAPARPRRRQASVDVARSEHTGGAIRHRLTADLRPACDPLLQHEPRPGPRDFLAAALNVLDAAETTNQLYAQLTGADGTQEAAFDAGRINAAALQGVQPQIDQISVDLAKANVALHQIPPDISPLLREYVDEAQARIDGIQRGLRVYSMIEPALPELLGETKPATYLVVFHNPGELYPGGGAALSAAVVEFSNGKMEVLDKGAVSSHFFPGNPEVPWDPAAGGPYYEKTERPTASRGPTCTRTTALPARTSCGPGRPTADSPLTA
jgi:hypothetical protein